MPLETLEFEEPIAALLKEIDALSLLPRTDAIDRELAVLRRRMETVRGDLYRSLTPWQRVLVARHPNRPGLEDFIGRLFTGFTEIHGDRRFADDHAIMTGFAEYRGQPVLLSGTSRAATPRKRSSGTSATRGPRDIARRCAPCAWRRSFIGRSSSSWIRRQRTRESSRRSAASRRRSRSTCAT